MRPKHVLMTLFGLLLLVTLAAPVWAGDEHEKCSMETQACLNKMSEYLKTSGWVGIEMDWDKDLAKYRIKRVVPESPAQTAGIKSGDILFAMYGIEFNEDNSKKLKQARKDWTPGQEVVYTVKRNGYDKEISLTLAPMPADVMAQWIGNHMMEHAELADLAQATP